jgi:hypothetical protein
MEDSQDNFTAEINSSMLSWDSSEDTVQATGMGSELRTARMTDAHEMLRVVYAQKSCQNMKIERE